MQFLRHILASRRRAILLAVICLAVLSYVDWITGPSVSVICFYLVPVFLLSWYGGRAVGLIVAICHAVVWLALDVQWLPNHAPSILAWNFAVRFVTFAGVVWLVYLCRNLTGEVQRLIADKTSALEREVAMRAANEEAVRQLASQLSVAEDSERRRLGHELHDSLGQSLSVLKLQLEAMTRDEHPDMQGSLAILSSVIQQARTLTFELYPSMLDQLGLAATLQHYGRQLASHVPTTIQISDAGPDLPLPPAVNSFLFRAAKELINNALKHGHAQEIVVQIRRRAAEIRVVVSDDGAGFLPEAVSDGGGLGLAWIEERVRCFGGALAVESAPAHGARVLIGLPVAVAEERELLIREDHGEPVAG